MKIRMLSICCIASATVITFSLHAMIKFPRRMIVTAPVADIRAEPEADTCAGILPRLKKDNPLQITQVLMGEYLMATKACKNYTTNQGWFYVYALEQRSFAQGKKINYAAGWIQENQIAPVTDFPATNIIAAKQWVSVYERPNTEAKEITSISIGTKLLSKKLDVEWSKVFLPNGSVGAIRTKDIYYNHPEVHEDEASLRKNICATAATFLGNQLSTWGMPPYEPTPYNWGGRSAYDRDNSQQTSVDAPGLINLMYRANGLEIPRDAIGQYVNCNKIKHGKDVKPGDLIFFASQNNPYEINHVTMCTHDQTSGGYLILQTSPADHGNTHQLADIHMFDTPITKLKSGDVDKTNVVYFGSYLNDRGLITILRNQSLCTTFPEPRQFAETVTTTTSTEQLKTA